MLKVSHDENGCFWDIGNQGWTFPREVPHACGVPNCHGDLNRRKLTNSIQGRYATRQISKVGLI